MKRIGMFVISLCALSALSCGNAIAEEKTGEGIDITPECDLPTLVECRIREEQKVLRREYTLIPHKQNYALIYSYNKHRNHASWIEEDGEVMNEEFKFQLSYKYPLWYTGTTKPHHVSFFVGYTQLALWQVYNRDVSSPFREINHEPELMMYYFPLWRFGNYSLPMITLALNHQSNGRGEPLSRSWNRVYIEGVLANGAFGASLRYWWRLPESEADDDNRDILSYMGRGDLKMVYKFGNNERAYIVSMLVRNNLNFEDENRGAVQLDFSFPLDLGFYYNKKLKIFVQAFHGYGESLIDYNHSTTRAGIGVLTTNWL